MMGLKSNVFRAKQTSFLPIDLINHPEQKQCQLFIQTNSNVHDFIFGHTQEWSLCRASSQAGLAVLD